MVSDKYRCIFVHIPKAAGQSVETFFLRLHGLSWRERAALLLRYNADPLRGPERLAHLLAREYLSFGYVTPDNFARYFKFSFVRNPWDRIVSEYHFRYHAREMSFREFVMEGLPEVNSYDDAYRHIQPQYDFLYDGNGRQLVDMIGRFENLHRDFAVVCRQLGIENSGLPHVNAAGGAAAGSAHDIAGPKRHYTAYYDEETARYVGTLYARDRAAFGYRFGA